MSNQFSDYGLLNKEVSSREGIQQEAGRDTTFLNLCRWAERLENWGKALFVIFLIYGAYLSYTSAKTINDTMSIYVKESEKTTTIVVSVITVIITYVFYAVLEYLAFHTFALLVSALSRIVYNTKVTAMAGLFCGSIEILKTANNNNTFPVAQYKNNNISDEVIKDNKKIPILPIVCGLICISFVVLIICVSTGNNGAQTDYRATTAADTRKETTKTTSAVNDDKEEGIDNMIKIINSDDYVISGLVKSGKYGNGDTVLSIDSDGLMKGDKTIMEEIVNTLNGYYGFSFTSIGMGMYYRIEGWNCGKVTYCYSVSGSDVTIKRK